MAPASVEVATVHVEPLSEEISRAIVRLDPVSSARSYVTVTCDEPVCCEAATLLTTGAFVSTVNAKERTLPLAFAKESVARMRTFMVALNCPAKSDPASHVMVLFVPAVCAAPMAPASVEVATVHVEPLSEEISRAMICPAAVKSVRSYVMVTVRLLAFCKTFKPVTRGAKRSSANAELSAILPGRTPSSPCKRT